MGHAPPRLVRVIACDAITMASQYYVQYYGLQTGLVYALREYNVSGTPLQNHVGPRFHRRLPNDANKYRTCQTTGTLAFLR